MVKLDPARPTSELLSADSVGKVNSEYAGARVPPWPPSPWLTSVERVEHVEQVERVEHMERVEHCSPRLLPLSVSA